MRLQIKNNGLDVLDGFGKFIKFLIAAGLVVKNGNNEIPVDDSAATRSVLQYFFCLVEIY